MSFSRLVVCLDRSVSMSGEKLDTAKKILSQIAADFKCKTVYYQFDGELTEITEQQFKDLSAGGGTAIEHALNRLFGVELPKYIQDHTKFFFVTDAEDEIEDVAACIALKNQCESTFCQGLQSEAILTGSGQCAEALKRIFGEGAFHTTTDQHFGDILDKLSTTMVASNNTATWGEETKTALEEDMIESKKGIDETQSQLDEAAEAIQRAQQSDDAALKTHKEVESALKDTEDKIIVWSGQVGVADENEKAALNSKAKTESDALSKQSDILQQEEVQLDQVTKETKKAVSNMIKAALEAVQSFATMQKKAEAKFTEIEDACKEMNALVVGNRTQINATKRKIENLLTALEDQMENDGKVMVVVLERLTAEFRETLRSLENRRTDNKQYQAKVEQLQVTLFELLQNCNCK